jgi:hemerythrin
MDLEYKLGIDEIDKQHEELLERMDLLRDYVRRGRSKDAIADTLKFLTTYAEEHFATEMKYMNRYSYPERHQHKAEHEVFLSDLAAFKERLATLQAQGEITTFLGLDIARKLNAWFTNHIATVDKAMGEYLAGRIS